MADNSNKLLVVLDKYQDRVDELVVVTATSKNRKAVEGARSAATMDMKTFVSKSFSTKMFVNIFDGSSEEWLWEVNPKISHIHAKCVELWGQPKEEPKEEELEESVEEEPESEEPAEEVASDDSEVEESVEEEPESEEPAEEVASDDSEVEEESKQDLFAAAKQAAAKRKAANSKSSKKATASKKVTSKKATASKKVEEDLEEEELEDNELEEEELEDEETTKKSGFLVWVLACVVIAIAAVSLWLTLKPGRELETLGLTAQYTEATNRLNQEVEPKWYRWESWDREVAAEATLVWGPYFRALYVEGEGKNPTPNSIQLYAVYLTLKVLVQQGNEPGEALRVIREEGSKSIISALNKGNISAEDIAFIREYMMK